jgi:hypothetical protein
MLTIVINNLYELEVPNEDINYTLQVNDITELSSRQCNYTDSFSIPKTTKNVNIFNQLGYVGDISNYPYEKVNADLLDNGVHVIRNGWLDIQETAKEYKINIREGSIDLFKAIENKTFGDNVNLSEINHNKTLATVIDSFTNEDYRYIINDYGGKTHTENGAKINIDYLIPSARVSYLWDKIFTTFGFNYIGDVFSTTDFTDLWITYPKGYNVIDNTINFADLKSVFSQSFLPPNNIVLPTYKDWNTLNTISSGSLVNNFSYVTPEEGSYQIKVKAKGLTRYYLKLKILGIFANSDPTIYRLVIKINGVFFNEFFSNEEEYIFETNLSSGDVIEYEITDAQSNASLFPQHEIQNFFDFLRLEEITLKIEKYDSLISFSDELKNLKITDFFKEILNIFSLTIFIDKDNNYIFKNFTERLEAGVVDWSEKYKERTSETYIPKTYAQRNYFKEKYNDENANYNDGYFDISNKNISERKDVINSIFYSHEKDFVSFFINSTSNENVYPNLLWQREVNENNGVAEIKYKQLSNRFYLIKSKTINKACVLKSEKFSLEQAVSSIPIARHNFTTYKDFVPKYYKDINLFLDKFRIHKMILNLNCIDIHNLDFDKIYYFDQEQNYYFLNKITYKNGRLSNGDFYRVRKNEVVYCDISTIDTITYEDDVVCEVPSLTGINLVSQNNYQITGSWTSSVFVEFSQDNITFTRLSSLFQAGSMLNVEIPLQNTDFFARLVAVCDETKISNSLEYDYREEICLASIIDSIIFN